MQPNADKKMLCLTGGKRFATGEKFVQMTVINDQLALKTFAK